MKIKNLNKVKIILIASISLNIILIAFHLGHKLGAFRHGPRAPFEREEQKIIEILPQNRQQDARQTFAKIREIHQNNSAQMQQQMQKVEEQVVAKEFDAKKFLSEFAKSDSLMSQMRAQTNQEIAKFLSSLSQEEREKVVKEIKNGRSFFGKKPSNFEGKEATKEPSLKEKVKSYEAPKTPTYQSSNDD